MKQIIEIYYAISLDYKEIVMCCLRSRSVSWSNIFYLVIAQYIV